MIIAKHTTYRQSFKKMTSPFNAFYEVMNGELGDLPNCVYVVTPDDQCCKKSAQELTGHIRRHLNQG